MTSACLKENKLIFVAYNFCREIALTLEKDETL